MPSQLTQNQIQVFVMASKNLQCLVSAASLISSPTTFLYHWTPGTWPFLRLFFKNIIVPQNLAFLFHLPGMAFPRSPDILHFIQVLIQMAPNRKQPFHKLTHYIPTPSSYSFFFFLAILITEPSVCVITFQILSSFLLDPLEFKLHESRNFILFTVAMKTSAPRTMPTSWKEL